MSFQSLTTFVRVRRPLLGLWVVFFVNGAVLASWAPRIPEVQGALSMSDSTLGLVLFGVAAGSVPGLLAAPRLVAALGSRRSCLGAAVAFAAGLPLIAAAQGATSLACVLAALGSASGILDVAMNTAGVEFETRSNRRVLSRLHGGYSLGVLCGASGGAIATSVGVPLRVHFLAVGFGLALLATGAALQLDRAGHPRGSAIPSAPWELMTTIGAPIAAIAVAALLVEGMLTDWSALLIGRERGAGVEVGSTVVVAFSVAMFVSRSLGDRLLHRVGAPRLLATAAIAIGTGTATASLYDGWVGAYLGVVAVGLAVGPVFPLAIGLAAARSPSAAPAATAAVSCVGYLAYLGGPPVIGAGADLVSLPAAIAGCGITSAAVVAFGAMRLARDHRAGPNIQPSSR
ncbi:MFS transporter [Tsukamurella sp. TY48]|uniref:MFS transporter n=1 Tax=Tsukamurella sp. TY48 TaxID=2775495 RepID=UPI0020897E48|nr:MFS transporter [Tsukamurella sp. TY48]